MSTEESRIGTPALSEAQRRATDDLYRRYLDRHVLTARRYGNLLPSVDVREPYHRYFTRQLERLAGGEITLEDFEQNLSHPGRLFISFLRYEGRRGRFSSDALDREEWS